MSAFMVSDNHIDYLVSAIVHWQLRERNKEWMFAPEVAELLSLENRKSLYYRYSDKIADEMIGNGPAKREPKIVPVTPVQVLKAVHCYEYQACEHPTWENSLARKLCKGLEAEAISRLPGYEEAPWGHPMTLEEWREAEGLADEVAWEEWLEANGLEAVIPALCAEGCEVEPDGTCEHGHDSVLIAAGLI